MTISAVGGGSGTDIAQLQAQLQRDQQIGMGARSNGVALVAD